MGGLRDRHGAARCRRHDHGHRHAAQLHPADARRRGVRRQGRSRGGRLAGRLRALGRARARPPLDALDELAARGVVGFKAFMSTSGIDGVPGRRRRDAGRGHGARREARAARRSARRERRADRRAGPAGLVARAARRCATTSRRVRSKRRPRRSARALALAARDRLRAACRARQQRRRRRARGRGPCPRRGRLLRDLPALPRARRGRCGAPRGGGQVRAAAAPARGARGALGRPSRTAACRWSPPTTRRRRPSSSGRRRVLGLGRDRGLPDAAAAADRQRRGWTPRRSPSCTAASPARRFRSRRRAGWRSGADADLVCVDPAARWTLSREDLLNRHQLSPFVGRELHARVVRTIVRGRTVARDGRITAPPSGRVLRRG